jgi:L-threonylcarbamoyladenylate synthase
VTEASAINTAVSILRKGGLVAFPTETVYGLGADAENAAAVRAIFKVKGRPESHPLIVHIGDAKNLSSWASSISDTALLLAQSFWPGPLTLILKRSRRVIDEVTGGQETVGLRIPDHPLALKLLRAFGAGVAAPSANRFGRVSPTCADHVFRDLGKDVDYILDGGTCSVGIESTIVDVSSGDPVILRPGGLSRERLEELLRRKIEILGAGPVRVSGQLESHYAPRAAVLLIPPLEAVDRANTLRTEGKRVELLGPEDVTAPNLYASLRRADESGAEWIVVPLPEEVGLGLAVTDRLRKAAAPRA